MSTRNFCIFFLFVPVILTGCSQALPSTMSDNELSKHTQRAEAAAKEARLVSDESERVAEENRRLMSEIREIAARTEQAEKNCAALLLRIPKPKPRVVVCKPAVEKATEAKPEEKAAPAVLEYSPSDAPVAPAPKVEEK